MTALLLALTATQRDSGMEQVLRLLVQVPTVREYIEIDDSPTVTAKEQRESRLALDKRFTEVARAIAKQPQGTIRAAVELINMEENGDLSNMQADQGKSSARLGIQRLLGLVGSNKPVPKLGASVELVLRVMFDCDVTDPKSEINSATSLFDYASLVQRGEFFNRQDPVVFRERNWGIDTKLAQWGGAGSVPRDYSRAYDYYAKRFKLRDLDAG
jgi:hypothetical protein